ncbi:MAG: hypothetical protein Q8P39_02525 [Candidatus Yanofskybacteria bacterium]|nr:hypothetical protein [Candidatus Yanofskybacteria bacterium]
MKEFLLSIMVVILGIAAASGFGAPFDPPPGNGDPPPPSSNSPVGPVGIPGFYPTMNPGNGGQMLRVAAVSLQGIPSLTLEEPLWLAPWQVNMNTVWGWGQVVVFDHYLPLVFQGDNEVSFHSLDVGQTVRVEGEWRGMFWITSIHIL